MSTPETDQISATTPAATAGQAAERFLALQGTLNTRDLGGLPVTGGGFTRHGHYLRSDGLLGLTDEDIATLAALPLTTVIDLRQDLELAREPSRLLGRTGITVHNIEIWSRIELGGGTRPADRFDLTAAYLAALDFAGGAFAEAVTALATADGVALFHCTAGKDRTGLLAALVLESVGVDRQTVIDDFALTHERIGPLRERLLDQAEQDGYARSDFERLLGATPEIISPALDHLDARYGGAVPYLQGAGVSDDTLAILKSRLVG